MNDVRFGLRILARNPGSTMLIVSLLALGTGASTTIFSLFDAILLRPLPVPHPEQLVRMIQRLPKPIGARSEFPYAYYEALRDRGETLSPVFAETEWHEHLRMTEPEPSEDVTVHGVTPEFFTAIGSICRPVSHERRWGAHWGYAACRSELSVLAKALWREFRIGTDFRDQRASIRDCRSDAAQFPGTFS